MRGWVESAGSGMHKGQTSSAREVGKPGGIIPWRGVLHTGQDSAQSLISAPQHPQNAAMGFLPCDSALSMSADCGKVQTKVIRDPLSHCRRAVAKGEEGDIVESGCGAGEAAQVFDTGGDEGGCAG